MTDNLGYTPGAGATIATTDQSGVHHQKMLSEGRSSGSYYPQITEPGYLEGEIAPININADGMLETRSSVLTDEGSFYTSFPGTTLPSGVLSTIGTGQTITVANSQCVITAGTTANAEAYIEYPIDYLPLHCEAKITISQRISNQEIFFELADGVTPAADTQFARFRWAGTTNTFVRCESQSSVDTNGNEGTGTDLNQTTTATATQYNLEIVPTGATFFYDDVKLIVRKNERIDPYLPITLRIRVKNGSVAPLSNTTITIDWFYVSNVNRIEVGTNFHSESLLVALNDSYNEVTQGIDAPWEIQGNRSNNASTPGGTNIGVIPGVVHATPPTYTDGNQASPSLTTSGDTRVTLDGEGVTVSATNLDIRDLTSASDSVAAVAAGSIAHDSPDSGNPVKIGTKAESSLATITLVADADRTDLLSDLDGSLLIKPLVPFGDIKQDRVADTGGTSTAFTNFGATANTRNYITTISIFNSSATDGYVDFRDGTAGTVLFTAPAPKGGGSIISFPVPLRQPTANTALAYDVSGAITTVYISVVGFQSKV